jgi:hypothetical protein
MIRRRRRRFALVALWAAALALLSADLASADPVPAWSGTKEAFAWEARRVGCGIVGRSPSVVRAHTRSEESGKRLRPPNVRAPARGRRHGRVAQRSGMSPERRPLAEGQGLEGLGDFNAD